MAAFTSKASGGWDTEGQTTWNEAGHPVAGDDVTIATGHAITCESATACATLTINGTGSLNTTGSNYSLTVSGATTTATGSTLTCNASTCQFGASAYTGTYGLYSNGTFAGGSGTHSFSSFYAHGGTFTATSGTCTITSAGDSNDAISRYSGCTFNHNNGTIILTRNGVNNSWMDGGITVYNLTLNIGSANTWSWRVNSAGTVTVANNLTITSGTLDTSVTSGSPMNLTVTGATSVSGTLTCNTSTISLGSGRADGTHALTVNGTFNGGSGTHTIGNITINFGGAVFTATSGTMTLDGYNTSSAAGIYISGGTFTHNSGTINCTYNGNCSFWKNAGDGVFTFYNLSNIANNNIKFASQQAVIYVIANNLTIGGTLNTQYTSGGAWINVDVTITGDLDNNGTFTVNTSTVKFDKVGTSICAMNGQSFYNLNCSGSTQVNVTEAAGILSGGALTPSTSGSFVPSSGIAITFA